MGGGCSLAKRTRRERKKLKKMKLPKDFALGVLFCICIIMIVSIFVGSILGPDSLPKPH